MSVLEEAGHTASHWSTIGSLNAPDREVLLWAKANGYLLFTHDLDFGAILAATEAEGPSVIQIRAQDISPDLKAGAGHDAFLKKYVGKSDSAFRAGWRSLVFTGQAADT